MAKKNKNVGVLDKARRCGSMDCSTRRRVSSYAKLAAGFVAAYAVSPIDLIPDFIPVIGYLDDFILLPLGIMLAVKLISVPLMQEFRIAAASRKGPPVSWAAATVIWAIWLIIGLLLLNPSPHQH